MIDYQVEANVFCYPFHLAIQHIDEFRHETEWNCRAVVHLVMGTLEMLPFVNIIIAVFEKVIHDDGRTWQATVFRMHIGIGAEAPSPLLPVRMISGEDVMSPERQVNPFVGQSPTRSQGGHDYQLVEAGDGHT